MFTPPARLEKRTSAARERPWWRATSPPERGGNKQTLRLSQYPGVAVLIDSIRSTLAGDLKALTKTYSAAVSGDAAKWRLTLRPMDLTLGALVEHIEITGSQGQVRTVEIFQADGDRSVMTLTPIEP